MNYKHIYRIIYNLNAFGPLICACKAPDDGSMFNEKLECSIGAFGGGMSWVGGLVLCSHDPALRGIAASLIKMETE